MRFLHVYENLPNSNSGHAVFVLEVAVSSYMMAYLECFRDCKLQNSKAAAAAWALNQNGYHQTLMGDGDDNGADDYDDCDDDNDIDQ